MENSESPAQAGLRMQNNSFAVSLTIAAATGLALALLMALVPTAIDWHQNPGGVFRGTAGISWQPLLETLWSWFWPLALFTTPVALAPIIFRKIKS
jgi:hypothetical protein